MRKMWSRTDVNPDERYVLLLMQDADMRRYVELCPEIDSQSISEINPDYRLRTELAPTKLLQSRDIFEIAKSVRLASGEPFHFDAHGCWLTDDEFMDIFVEHRKAIRWFGGNAPQLAPR